MGLMKINNQCKIKCLECGLTMDNAYQMKHNNLLPCWNAETTQNGRLAKYQHSKESFRRSATSSGKETPHRWSICVYITCCQCKLYCWQILYDQYYCYNNWSFQMQFYQNRKIIFSMYWKRGKQSSTIQKPLSHKICHINLRTQNVSWNMEISHNHSNHPELIMKIARPG